MTRIGTDQEIWAQELSVRIVVGVVDPDTGLNEAGYISTQ